MTCYLYFAHKINADGQKCRSFMDGVTSCYAGEDRCEVRADGALCLTTKVRQPAEVGEEEFL